MSERIHFTVGGREHYHPLVDDVASLVLRAEAAEHQLAAVEAERDTALAEVERLREALTYISEYWNGHENPMATSDAANMARDTALAALGLRREVKGEQP